jgi:hypothetical protein
MPEPPDFDQLAFDLCVVLHVPPSDGPAIAAQLRQVWNTRGLADRAKLEGELSSQMGATAAGPYVKNLDRALRSLDR